MLTWVVINGLCDYLQLTPPNCQFTRTSSCLLLTFIRQFTQIHRSSAHPKEKVQKLHRHPVYFRNLISCVLLKNRELNYLFHLMRNHLLFLFHTFRSTGWAKKVHPVLRKRENHFSCSPRILQNNGFARHTN